jgi:hypothetical protein
MNYFISHTSKGFSAKAIPGKDLPKDIYETFAHAVVAFGHLVQLNEKISAQDWISRIQKQYASSLRIEAVIKAINTAMPDITIEVKNEVFIEFLNKDKGFKKDKIDFPAYQDAIKWGRKELENFNIDMIKFY